MKSRGFFERLGAGVYQRTARGVNWRVVSEGRGASPVRDHRTWRVVRNGEHYDRVRSLRHARQIITAKEYRVDSARARKAAGIRLSDLSRTQGETLRWIDQNSGAAGGAQYRTTDALYSKGYLFPWNGRRHQLTAKGNAWVAAYYSSEAHRSRPRRVK